MKWTFGQVALTALAVIVLFGPSLVSFFEDRLFPYDLSKVFLADGCSRRSSQTIFITKFLEVLVAAALIGHYTAPAIFGDKWNDYDSNKQRKMTGNIVKIVVRMCCLVLLFVFVMPNLDEDWTLFDNLSSEEAHAILVEKGIAVTCEDAGATLETARSLRSWVLARSQLMSVMAWDLAAVPGLGVDVWLHHIFVIIGVTLGTDAKMQGLDPSLQRITDGLAFLLTFGASLAASFEVFVLMYHLAAPNAGQQAKAMLASIVLQAVIVPVFFLVLPVWLAVSHEKELGLPILSALIAVLLFLVIVEARLILVKVKIWKKALQKQRQADRAAMDSEVEGLSVSSESESAASSADA